jgi:hypothetical protein
MAEMVGEDAAARVSADTTRTAAKRICGRGVLLFMEFCLATAG